MTDLRVIDASTVSAVRSQALWHGIATAATEASSPTLSFCRPESTYVGIGYHCDLEEIDRSACRRLGLPVLRRQIGGGPVLIDADQLFFQITIPASTAPLATDRLYAQYLEPAVDAFRALGVPARLRGSNDIAVEDRKISGTAAGRLGDGVTVVGNAIFRFPYETMAEVLTFSSATLRAEYLRLLRAHLSTLAAEGAAGVVATAVKEALVESFAAHLGLTAVEASLGDAEETEIRRWEERLSDPVWLAGLPTRERSWRQVKVCSGVWLYAARAAGLEVEASIVEGRIEYLAVTGDRLNGSADEMRMSLRGRAVDADSTEAHLRRFGRLGADLTELLRPAFELR